MTTRSDDTGVLVGKAVAGDRVAIEELFARHRAQLSRMIAVRLDPRLRGRLDPSDIVQDVLVEASQNMASEFTDNPVEYYAWLRGLAWDHLCRLHRHHVATYKRRVTREEPFPPADVDDESVLRLAECIAASGSGPGSQVMHDELRSRVREALTRLPENGSRNHCAPFLGTAEHKKCSRRTGHFPDCCQVSAAAGHRAAARLPG